MSQARRAARANLLLAPVGVVLAVVASVLVARLMGPDLYAGYAVLIALLAILQLTTEIGCNVGYSRFQSEAAELSARYSLYRTLQFRRWCAAAFVGIALQLLGPIWLGKSGFSDMAWGWEHFALVAMLSAITLHGQLANAALMSAFQHKKMLMVSQAMMLLRAIAVCVVAVLFRSPEAIIVSLLIVAAVETWLVDRFAVLEFARERAALPGKIANSAQLHGMIALFDKITTALTGAPFLLLVVAGAYSRYEMAMFAVAADLLQKGLGVIGLPVSNLVLPTFNANRADKERFKLQIERLGGVSVVWFSVATMGVATCFPMGIPLLLGDAYRDAVVVAFVLLLPLMFEAGVRMIWGVALLTRDDYRWLSAYNFLFGLASLFVVFLIRGADLLVLLGLLGMVRVSMSCLLLLRARSLGLLPRNSRPVGIVLASMLCCLLAIWVQFESDELGDALRLAIGCAVYVLSVLGCLRILPLIPLPSYQVLCSLAGRHAGVVKRVLAAPSEGDGRA